MNFADYFDRTWIINLAERTDRRRRIGKELDRVGLPLTPGRVEIFPAIRMPEAAGFPSPGYHGCFLSHRGVLERAVATGARNLLVLEDDLMFRPDFHAHEAAAIACLHARPDWGIVHFGYDIEERCVGRGLLTPPRTITGSHFLAVNGAVLPRLLRWFEDSLGRPAGHPEGSRMSPDGTMNHFRWAHPELPAFLHAPMLGRQWDSVSDLGARHWIDRLPLAGRMIRSASGMLRRQRWD